MRLLRPLAHRITNFYNLGKHGKAVAWTLDTCPPQAGLPCPLASASEKLFRPGCSQGAFALARLEGLQLHPVPFRKFPGRRGEVFISPTRGIVQHLAAPLALARARKRELFRVRQCRSGGIPNIKIVLEYRHFHKVIVRRSRTINPTNSVR